MPIWPGDPPTVFRHCAQLHTDGFFLRQVEFSEHSGTHMNAPCSFVESGCTVENLIHSHGWNERTLRGFIWNMNSTTVLPAGTSVDFVIFADGISSELWSDNPRLYQEGQYDGPRLSLVEELVDEGVSIFGTETAGIDGREVISGVGVSSFPINMYCAKNNLGVIENLNLSNIRTIRNDFMVLLSPLLLEGGSGCPVCPSAILNKT